MAIVVITNLLVGLGLLSLGVSMLRRPDRLWVGVRPPGTTQEAARIRRMNGRMGPWLVLLGIIDLLSVPLGLLAGIDPLLLAIGGLGILLVAILSQALVTILSK